MGISGTQKSPDFALSGLARAGATRAGYVPVGKKLPLYCLSAVARSGATRSGYYGPKAFIAINGVEVNVGSSNPAYSVTDCTVTEQQGQATTATLTIKGFAPSVGMSVLVRLGSKNNAHALFTGRVLSVQQGYDVGPSVPNWQISAIDQTWDLNKRKVTARFTATSASAIAATLIAVYAPGTVTAIEANLDEVDEITFTAQDLADCLTQLATDIGGYWYRDYDGVVHFFEDHDPTSRSQPRLLNAVHPTLANVTSAIDLSQVVTRMLVQGGGVNAAAAIEPGDTILPVDDAAWYDVAGGIVTCGPQRVTYTGLNAGGGGGLVGPGAAPTGISTATAVAGTAGVNSGVHNYAVTFVTGSGESITGPLATVTTGNATAPTVAPTLGAPTIGTGPDAGAHNYAITFVNAGGETTPGPIATQSTDITSAPASSPTAGTPTAGTGVDDGNHEYAVTHVTSIGETTIGPVSAQVTTAPLAAPISAPTPGTPTTGSGVDAGIHQYASTFVTSVGETTPSPLSSSVTTVDRFIADPAGSMTMTPSAADTGAWAIGDTVRVEVTYIGGVGETLSGAGISATAVAGSFGQALAFNVSAIPVPTDPAVIDRRLYVRAGSAWLGYLSLGTVGSFQSIGFTAFSSPGSSPPGSSTAEVIAEHVPLTAIPTGPASVTSRKLYRTAAGASQLKLVATLADNTTTTYSDTTADASLGANAPSSNTAAINQVPLTGIPLGDANVTSRRLYRRIAGTTNLRLVATLADNTTTTYSDTTADASIASAPTPPSSSTAYIQRISLSAIPLGDGSCTARKVYRTAAGGSQLKLAATISDNTTTTFTDTVTDASLGANVPASNTAAENHVAVASILIGAAAVTSRKLYRTAAGGSQLKLVATLADNTTTTYTDTTADASLGANAPTSDASGLAQPNGNVLQGATSLPVASMGSFPSRGWAIVGNGQQAIYYSGVSATALTGIPATGNGALTASVTYGSTVTACPQLTGIPSSGDGAILWAIIKGDPVNVFVIVNDMVKQAELAALIGGDGVIEGYQEDGRFSIAECLARGLAQLALTGSPATAISYTARDVNTRAGTTVTALLAAPTSVAGDFVLQKVMIGKFLAAQYPTYTVQASSTRFSFEDLLRLARKG